MEQTRTAVSAHQIDGVVNSLLPPPPPPTRVACAVRDRPRAPRALRAPSFSHRKAPSPLQDPYLVPIADPGRVTGPWLSVSPLHAPEGFADACCGPVEAEPAPVPNDACPLTSLPGYLRQGVPIGCRGREDCARQGRMRRKASWRTAAKQRKRGRRRTPRTKKHTPGRVCSCLRSFYGLFGREAPQGCRLWSLLYPPLPRFKRSRRLYPQRRLAKVAQALEDHSST